MEFANWNQDTNRGPQGLFMNFRVYLILLRWVRVSCSNGALQHSVYNINLLLFQKFLTTLVKYSLKLFRFGESLGGLFGSICLLFHPWSITCAQACRWRFCTNLCHSFQYATWHLETKTGNCQPLSLFYLSFRSTSPLICNRWSLSHRHGQSRSC